MRILAYLGFAALAGCSGPDPPDPPAPDPLPPPVGRYQEVFDLSAERRPHSMYVAFDPAEWPLTAAQAAAIRAAIEARPDRSAYLPLMDLRDRFPAEYARLRPGVRAAVLRAALAGDRNMNDWGWPEEGHLGWHDGPAADALAELGEAAVPALAPLLGDPTPVALFGSQLGGLDGYRLRRSDYAHRLVNRAVGRPDRFDPDPAVRDGHIAGLRAWLAGQGMAGPGP